MKRLAYSAPLLAIVVLVFASIAAAQTSPDQSTMTVSIHDRTFDPAQLDVAPGTTVTWVNEDVEPHTVTANDGLFDSGVLEPGASYSVWFDGAGTVPYHCALHPDMQGSVVVGGASEEEGATTEDSASNPAPTSSDPMQTITADQHVPGSEPSQTTGGS